MKLLHALLAVLLASLSVGLVEARGGTFIISPSGEAIEKVQLSPPDSVFGNMSVSGGFVDFFVTNPSYDIVYQSLKTSFNSFNFTADENGTYAMHFVNKYQSGDVNVTLSYGINFFVFVSSVMNVSVSIFTTQTTTSGGVIVTHVQPNPKLILNVVPLAFPVVGQFWELSTYYETNSSDGTTYYSPLPNATVNVAVRIGNETKVYSTVTDQAGQTKFQFLAEYSDISFWAVSGENKSDIYALTQRAEHYVRNDFVDLIFQVSLSLSSITAVIETIMLYFRKRIRVIFNLLVGAVLCFSLVELVISLYAQLNWWTPWGYPESIFGFVTWTFLGYASFTMAVLFAILVVLAYFLRLRSPKPVVPLK